VAKKISSSGTDHETIVFMLEICACTLLSSRSDPGLMSCGYRPWDQNCRRTLLTQLTDRFFGRNSPSHGIFSCKRFRLSDHHKDGNVYFLKRRLRPWDHSLLPLSTLVSPLGSTARSSFFFFCAWRWRSQELKPMKGNVGSSLTGG